MVNIEEPIIYTPTNGEIGDITASIENITQTNNFKQNAVQLKDPNLKISVSSVHKSEKPVIVINCDKMYAGNVNVKIGSKNYIVKIVNGKGTLTIPSHKIGKYTAQAILKENNIFKGSTKSTTFQIKPDIIKLTLNKVKVKKSAKKLKIKATLKINNKKAKGKKLVFKFKNKKYTVKTNKNGIAKITIKKNILKKLKKGKKLTYKVTYNKKTIKRTTKIK